MKSDMASDKSRRGGSVKHSSSKPASHRGVHKAKNQKITSPPSFSRKSYRGNNGIREDETIGTYRTEITSGEGKRCGVFSLEISTAKQLNGLTLKPKAFDEILGGKTSQEWHQKKGWTGRGYRDEFFDEQLALVLYLWGLEQGKTLQLGVILEGVCGFQLPLPKLEGEQIEPLDGAIETVWIHNDNAQMLMGRPCNHFSGITMMASSTKN